MMSSIWRTKWSNIVWKLWNRQRICSINGHWILQRNSKKHKHFILLVCHDVFVKQYSKHKSKSMDQIQMQRRTAPLQYDKRSITQSFSLLESALRMVWAGTGERFSKAFKVTLKSPPRLFYCIKAIQFVFTLLIMKRWIKTGGEVIETCQILRPKFLQVKMVCPLRVLFQVKGDE